MLLSGRWRMTFPAGVCHTSSLETFRSVLEEEMRSLKIHPTSLTYLIVPDSIPGTHRFRYQEIISLILKEAYQKETVM